MTPKEKAKELFDEYTFVEIAYYSSRFEVKQCALIAVDEILKVTAPIIDRYEPYYQELSSEMTQAYWQEVKKEIEKL
jgi:L-asparaginase/Glu-tRNA(Gln) amidotransferase subunit D